MTKLNIAQKIAGSEVPGAKKHNWLHEVSIR
jgi:hypothetical protein